MTGDAVPKRSFLVLHDYGMGGFWWWISARSEREIRETFAWVEVVTDPDVEARHRNTGLPEADIDDAEMPAVLDRLRAERAGQRGRPGFGEFADREVVYLRRRMDEENADWLAEIGPDGRRIRDLEVADDGTSLRGEPDDWPFNSPVVDLFAPEIADEEISAAEFEERWARARPAADGFSE
ncbi:hypothetical protein [Amycolatopsis silviterrae]|uniref:Uncharacterized protein n=1 Tax=Amycolatopsis silviterrae TaxID=1656914 RepID=A0ABW5H7K9_9PSEU